MEYGAVLFVDGCVDAQEEDGDEHFRYSVIVNIKIKKIKISIKHSRLLAGISSSHRSMV